MDPQKKIGGLIRAWHGLEPKVWQEIAVKTVGIFILVQLLSSIILQTNATGLPEFDRLLGVKPNLFEAFLARFVHSGTYVTLLLIWCVCLLGRHSNKVVSFLFGSVGLMFAVNWFLMVNIARSGLTLSTFFSAPESQKILIALGIQMLAVWALYYLLSWIYREPSKSEVKTAE